jgi:nitroreductase
MENESERNLDNNPVLRAIWERRSIRHFKPDKVPTKLVKKIIKAGTMAPSSSNLQPWRFVVIEDEKRREYLKQIALKRWNRVMEVLKDREPERFDFYQKQKDREDPVYYSAPVIIFVIGPSGVNCALACENMMLAAHSLGIGSCYVGWGGLVADDPETVKLLELKEKEKVYGPILIGYPDKQPEPTPRDEPTIKWV